MNDRCNHPMYHYTVDNCKQCSLCDHIFTEEENNRGDGFGN